MRFLTAIVCLAMLISTVAPPAIASQSLLEGEQERPLRWQAADSALPTAALTVRGAQLQWLWLGEFKARSGIGCTPLLDEMPPTTFRLADAQWLSHSARSTVLLQHVRLQL